MDTKLTQESNISAMKRKLKKIWLRLKSETPKFWNWVAGLATSIPLLVVAINEATSVVIVPKWYTENLFYVLGVAAVVTFYAKTRTTEAGKQQINQKLES